MSHGIPEEVVVEATSKSFRHFSGVIGAVSLSAAFLCIAGYQQQTGGPLLWLAQVALVVMAAALLQSSRRPGWGSAALYLLVGTAAQFAYATVATFDIPAAGATDSFLLLLPKVALIFVGGLTFGARATVLWCVLGYFLGESATLAAAAVAGGSPRFDVAAALVLTAVVATFALEIVVGRRARELRPRLQRAALEEHIAGLRYGIEVRAAALMHDTVLNHLAAVSTARRGALAPGLRELIERDLAILVEGEWLEDPASELDAEAQSTWEHSGLFMAINETEALGLRIEVTGDVAELAKLDRDRDTAVGLAAKQCLVNVLKHAGTDHAEVVIIGSETEISVMIIDAGSGFLESEVDSQRLGLRQSVRGRIEAAGGEVRVWSTPGRGTSVMIRVPVRVGLPSQMAVDDA